MKRPDASEAGDDASPGSARAPRLLVHGWSAPRAGVVEGTGRFGATGVPVRIRRFDGPPRGAPERLEHPALPGVLTVAREVGGTRLATWLPSDATPLAQTDDALTPDEIQTLADALAVAHAAGVVHGDLGPHRILRSGDGQLLLDGFGAPWRPDPEKEPTPSDDVRALASAAVNRGQALGPNLTERLTDLALGGDVAVRDGVALARAVHDAAAADATPGSEAVTPASDDRDAGSVVKNLPPGGVYRSGQERDATKPGRYAPSARNGGAERPAWRFTRRTWVLFGVLVAVSLASLWVQERTAPPAPPEATDSSFVLDVRLGAADDPPFEIVVVDAPFGSDLPAGTRLGRAPRRVLLDHEGRWVLRGEFGERSSEPVEVQVPSQRSVALPPARGTGTERNPPIP